MNDSSICLTIIADGYYHRTHKKKRRKHEEGG